MQVWIATRKEVNLVLRVDLHLAQALEARALEGMLANEDRRAFRDLLDTVSSRLSLERQLEESLARLALGWVHLALALVALTLVLPWPWLAWP